MTTTTLPPAPTAPKSKPTAAPDSLAKQVKHLRDQVTVLNCVVVGLFFIAIILGVTLYQVESRLPLPDGGTPNVPAPLPAGNNPPLGRPEVLRGTKPPPPNLPGLNPTHGSTEPRDVIERQWKRIRELELEAERRKLEQELERVKKEQQKPEQQKGGN